MNEKHDTEITNNNIKKRFFFIINLDIVQLQLLGPRTKASFFNAQQHIVPFRRAQQDPFVK